MPKWILLAAALVFAAGPTAMAMAEEAPGQLISEASMLYYEGKSLETYFKLKEVMEQIWNEAPLTVQNVHFVTEEPEAYGYYTPAETDLFESIDPVQLYFEPIGHVAKKEGEWYSFALTADYTLEDLKGEVLGGKQRFFEWNTQSRAFNTEFMMFVTFNFRGLPPGEYKISVTLHDANSDKQTTFDKNFRIK